MLCRLLLLPLACLASAAAAPLTPAPLSDNAAAVAAAGEAAAARLANQAGTCFTELLVDLAEGGTCAAVVEASDPAETQALRASVALSLTRCHYAASLRPATKCMEGADGASQMCLSLVTDAEFGIYTAFLNGAELPLSDAAQKPHHTPPLCAEVTSLCFHIAQAHWRGQVNDLVASLLSHATAARAVSLGVLWALGTKFRTPLTPLTGAGAQQCGTRAVVTITESISIHTGGAARR